MTLYVVRHAHAGRRSDWAGDDRTRPLSDRGELQAKGIAAAIEAGRGAGDPIRVLASPARRCVQTMEPLVQPGGEVRQDDRLFEGAEPWEVTSLLADVAATADGRATTVVCSHGDVIPILLRLLVEAGMEPERDLVWQKASAWVVDRTDGCWGTGHYLPPPDRA